jgi:hypothetical protein
MREGNAIRSGETPPADAMRPGSNLFCFAGYFVFFISPLIARELVMGKTYLRSKRLTASPLI